ncbi:ACP phosphodiesterase [Neptuniibacter halophilus]|uniref:acyl carrier protein phosphodiesterase n=1 Tax=Neptuniibacter halophilus TaxID=651666 RepID=UPI002573F6DD|nr:ACP phosphodiesterase [Neptuniibacter halophilus]
MNYLAHLFLAQSSVESQVGNLLGDFARGIRPDQLPSAVRRGLFNHRLVDRFTDQHPQVRELKSLISQPRRRFAGIMLDMVFDHYLIKHWHCYSERSFSDSCRDYYANLQRGRALMPLPMQQVTRRITEQDWFSSYAEIEGIGYALDRVATRIRFPHQFAGAVIELRQHEEAIEQGFLRFFPQLCAAVDDAALERHPVDEPGSPAQG